jgi:hypothetical protein
MVKIYVKIESGTVTYDGSLNYEIYTVDGPDKYISKFYCHSYNQNAWSFNTYTDWLPITTDMNIFVDVTTN